MGGGTIAVSERWQDEAWEMYNNLGEFRQGVTWLSNVVSRARLVAAYAPLMPGDEPEIIDPEVEDPATSIVEQIAGGIGGQAELLRSMGVHLSVPGEGWFIGEVKGDDLDISWSVRAADEIRTERRGNVVQYFVRTGPTEWQPLGLDVVPVRVWRPHSHAHWQADSSARAALPIMRRLELLNRHVDALAMSRLASNGVYWVASEIVFPESPDHPDADDPFIAQFMDNGITAIKTPGSAAAAFPIINRAPMAYIKDGIRYDTFGTKFDEQVLALREFEVRRLSTSMDVPPEVLLGMAGVNHWGGWQIEESALKTTVTSFLELVCWALTKNYLNPALASLPVDVLGRRVVDDSSPRRRIVWYDISELSVRPDRSQDAIRLSEHLQLNAKALFRETGLNLTDRLTDPEELKRAIAIKLIEQGTPQSIAYGLSLLDIATVVPDPATGVPIIVEEGETAPSRMPAPDRPEPPAPNGDSGGPPQTQDSPATEGAPRPVRVGG
jgi:hypothetical protein